MTMILLHIEARRLNRYMHRQKQLKHRKVKWFNNNIYMHNWNESDYWGWSVQPSNRGEDIICLITGKGIWYEWLIFLFCVGMRGNLVGARRWASKSGSRGEGVGNGERRKGELWNEKNLRQSLFLQVDKLAISATSSYNMGLLSQCSTAVRTVVRATQQVNGKWPFSGCQNSVTPEPID